MNVTPVSFKEEVIYDPFRDDVYALFAEYFGPLVMTKLKDVGTYSVYYARIHCSLINLNKYVIAFVEKNSEPLKTERPLKSLEWIFLQTRFLTDVHPIKHQSYNPRRFEPLMKEITITEQSKKGYVYRVVDLPIVITLLPKERGVLDYNTKGNVVVALETYHTIVSFVA
jgi:hypothetical protein